MTHESLGGAYTTDLQSDVSAVTYQENGIRRIYVFVTGSDGHLHVNYWDGVKWQWADQGKPTNTEVDSSPGVANFQLSTEKFQRIYAFVVGYDKCLHVNYWDGVKWQWADQGKPTNTEVWSSPGVANFQLSTEKFQRIYAFVVGNDKSLHVNYWDGVKWQWADQGKPTNTEVWSSPGVANFQLNTEKFQRIYAFVVGNDKSLHVNYWDGAKWQWADQGGPALGIREPSVITFRDASPTATQRIYAFVVGNDNHLHVNYWDGAKWQWADQGKPAP